MLKTNKMLKWLKGWPRCAVAPDRDGDMTFYSVNRKGELSLGGKGWERRNREVKGGPPVPRICKCDSPQQAMRVAELLQKYIG